MVRKEYSRFIPSSNNEDKDDDECYWKCTRPWELKVWIQDRNGKEYDIRPLKICKYCYQMIVDPEGKYRKEYRRKEDEELNGN